MKPEDARWASFYRDPRRFPLDVKRVLVIDDLEDFHRIVSRCLARHGVSVKGARAGAEGVALARAFQPDLIILDWVLKETTGEAVARLLRQDPATRSIPTIMVSAHIDAADAPRARAAGAHLFMRKEDLETKLLSYYEPAAPERPASRKVLVVEDDEGTQEYIRHILTKAGCETSFCRLGREGVEQARKTLPALVLLDVSLPDLNGVEVYSILRSDALTRGIRVMIMTSMSDAAGAMESAIRALHPDDFIHKPFGAEEFAARTLRLLDAATPDSAPGAPVPDLILRRGRISVDLTRHEVRAGSRLVELSPRLFALLRTLIVQEEPVSVERILAQGWPDCHDTGVLRKAVQRLRRCLNLAPDPIRYTGHSYQLIG